MDAKERAKLQSYHDKLNALTFDDDLVALLLMALRPEAKQGQPVREFADFIAHRTRERGPIYEYLKQAQASLPTLWADAPSGQRPDGPSVVFTEREVHDSLNAEFARHGFPFITTEASAAATVCIMSRLQRAVMEDRQGNRIAELEMRLSGESVDLVGVIPIPRDHPLASTIPKWNFAVLSVENDFVGIDRDLFIPDSPGYIEIRYHNGKPEVVVQDLLEHDPYCCTATANLDGTSDVTVKMYHRGELIFKRIYTREQFVAGQPLEDMKFLEDGKHADVQTNS